MTVSNTDLDKAQTFGRLVAQKDDREAFESAAEYMAVCYLEEGNFMRLWMWFEEGARNYADGMYHLESIQRRLRERVKELIA